MAIERLVLNNFNKIEPNYYMFYLFAISKHIELRNVGVFNLTLPPSMSQNPIPKEFRTSSLTIYKSQLHTESQIIRKMSNLRNVSIN